MKVKITTDSTCDLSPELLEKYDLDMISLGVTLGDRSGKDGTDITPQDIYAFVDRTGKLPKTSAVNEAEYLTFFGKWLEQGYAVVHFCISSDFSSCYQNACMAAEELENVYVVDSRNLSTGQGLSVLHAAELAAEGKSAEEIYEDCRTYTDLVEASFVLDKLDYLYKGGRCSALARFGANLMHLKPCIEVIRGKMEPTKKYRGALDKVTLEYVTDKLSGRTDLDHTRIFITHTTASPELIRKVEARINELAPGFKEILITNAGSTITSHCGPNTLGILFVRTRG
ncbi:MAG: DegV family protein [Clostridia bacterium]|nr:DegV family protein [Clostridia bacterium]MBR0444340.1 DegV family protein [Clostridia bacterium]